MKKDESGETEVKKDLEWLKGKINAFQEGENMFTAEFNAGVQDALEYVQELIDQLDEPEVLSREWIDEHEIHYNHWVGAVPVTDLQKLLVPKQEVNLKIQELIEKYEREDGAYSNPENGWIGGFIEDLKSLLEEEQKYIVSDNSSIPLLIKNDSGEIMSYDSQIAYNNSNGTIELTEQEIKDYDERYWPFAVKVEELEE